MVAITRGLESLGRLALLGFEDLGRFFTIMVQAVLWAPRRPFDGREWFKQMVRVGFDSIPVVFLTTMFTGMVLALQFHDTLARFGSIDLLGSATGLALIRELGPVMAALMVIGRAGSAMCSEIGIMRIYEQIDALECMAIDPHKFLVAPRIVAGLIAMPALASIAAGADVRSSASLPNCCEPER